jgi:hypothetical protein
MSSKVIGMNEDKGTNSMYCECGGSLVYQDEWDRLFDLYDKNTPAFDLIYNRIYKEDRQPKYICSECSLEVFVVPDYSI